MIILTFTYHIIGAYLTVIINSYIRKTGLSIKLIILNDSRLRFVLDVLECCKFDDLIVSKNVFVLRNNSAQ